MPAYQSDVYFLFIIRANVVDFFICIMPVVQIVSWAAFHRMDDPAAAAKEKHNMSTASSEPLPRISFVDCEGQGTPALRRVGEHDFTCEAAP